MGSASGKGNLKAAAAHLTRGIACYGEGDLAGALIEFEKALELYGPMRGKTFADWIKSMQADGTLDAARPPAKASDSSTRNSRRGTAPTAMETAATMTLQQQRTTPQKVTRDATQVGETPWDPVPLTPGNADAPPELRRDTLSDKPNMVPASAVAAAPTIHGMPALESKLLTPQNKKRSKVAEDRPESVTREFRSQTPTGPGLHPLDVPELTDEQIHSLLALDSPLIPEGRTTPQIELERIDHVVGLDETHEAEHLIEMEALPEPLPPRAPGTRTLKNDTNPMGVESFAGEFDPNQLTPTGIKPQGLKSVRESQPEDDPYADLNLLPLDVAPDLSGPDEVEEGGTNPTNPFIRGGEVSKLFQHLTHGSSPEIKLEDMPPLPSLPGTRPPPHGHPLGAAEAALQAGDLPAALDACEMALEASGGLGGEVAHDHLPLVEQIYGAVLGGPKLDAHVPAHGRPVADLEPRSAFLLSRIDGAMSVEDVLDVSGMPRLEALRVMALLVRRGAVVIK